MTQQQLMRVRLVPKVTIVGMFFTSLAEVYVDKRIAEYLWCGP